MSGTSSSPAPAADSPSQSWRGASSWRSAAASPRGGPSSAGSSRGGSGSGIRWGSSRDNNNNNNNNSSNSNSSSRKPSSTGVHASSPDADSAVSEGRRIYVGNLLYQVRPTDVEELLRERGFPAFERVHMSVDAYSGRNPGYCFVEFADRSAADAAISALDQAVLLDRPIKTGPCKPKGSSAAAGGAGGRGEPQQRWDDNDDRRTNTRRRNDYGDRNSGGYRARGDNPRDGGATTSSTTAPPEGPIDEDCRLYVGGLPRMTTQAECDKEMREFFAGFDIVAVSKPILPRNTGASWGAEGLRFCFVDFSNVDQAQQARADAQGRELGGRTLRVNYTKGSSSRAKEGEGQQQDEEAS